MWASRLRDVQQLVDHGLCERKARPDEQNIVDPYDFTQFNAHFGLSVLRGASFKSEPQTGTFGITQPFGTAGAYEEPNRLHES